MQKIIDSTLEEAIKSGCDTVQLKWDGVWSRFCVAQGKLHIRNHILREDEPTAQVVGIDPSVSCTLIGTYTPAGNLFVFDCWLVEEPPDHIIDMRKEPYRTRFVAAKLQVGFVGSRIELVTNYPISRAVELWKALPQFGNSAKGLVFRNSKEDAYKPIRVARWYPEVPRELT